MQWSTIQSWILLPVLFIPRTSWSEVGSLNHSATQKLLKVNVSIKTIWTSTWQNLQNGMCTQRNLRSACAYAQSDQSLLYSQWVAKDLSFLHTDSEDSDQTGQLPRLIWVFAGRTSHFVGFVIRWLMSMSKAKYSTDQDKRHIQKINFIISHQSISCFSSMELFSQDMLQCKTNKTKLPQLSCYLYYNITLHILSY